MNSHYTSALFKRSCFQTSLKQQLRGAMDNNEFNLVYQPQTDITGQYILGVEALLRWQSPRFGWVSPVDFIQVAEASGLMVELGKIVIDKACQQLASWQRNTDQSVRMAINVSAMQLVDAELVAYLDKSLNKLQIIKGSLEIEITETVLINNTATVINLLNQLKRIGIRVALDDFGTGYSSLSYLSTIPFDTIKIDQSFIAKLGLNKTNEIVTQSIIALCRSLGVRVLAEGVETEKQREILETYHCDLIQGFLMSEPESAETITKKLLDNQQLISNNTIIKAS